MEGVRAFSASLLMVLSVTAAAGRGAVNGTAKQGLPLNPETRMTTPQIIESRGYPAEVHSVTTEDGYILELHRIPAAKGQQANSTISKRVVFIQHGLISSSADWLFIDSNSSIAFRLADLGYDVWLGNARGNTYSRKHSYYDPTKGPYWDFSWDQMGRYDLPAVFDYVLSTTGREKLVYIGHSMGCIMFWVAMITHPELNDKIELMFGLGSVASMANLRGPLRSLARYHNTIQRILEAFQVRAFLTTQTALARFQRTFCDLSVDHANICRNILLYLVGADSYNFQLSIMPMVAHHDPAGTSVKTLVHFAQNFMSGESFLQFDHGTEINLKRYGQESPPPYNLNLVTAPVYLFWGQNDQLATPDDNAWLASQLGNLQGLIRVPYSMFNHLDFLYAYDVNTLLNNQIISLLPSPID